MNLSSLNLVELNAQEQKETEGGFFGLLLVAAPFVVAAVAAVGIAGSYQQGYNAGVKDK